MVSAREALAAAHADLVAAQARFHAAQQAAAEEERQAAAARAAPKRPGPSRPVQWQQVNTVNNYKWRCDARSPLYDPAAPNEHAPVFRRAPDPTAQPDGPMRPFGVTATGPNSQPQGQASQPAPNQAQQQPPPGPPPPNQAPPPPGSIPAGSHPPQQAPNAAGWPGAHPHQGPPRPPGGGTVVSMGILVPQARPEVQVQSFQPPVLPPSLHEPAYPPPVPINRTPDIPALAPESPSTPAVAAPSVPSGPRKRGRRPKTLEQMGLPRKIREALEAGRTTYLKGPRPQRYSEQEKKDVILYLIYHRVYADPRQLIRRLAGCPPSEIRNGWVYRSPTAVEAAAFFDIPNSTIANWWDKRNAILTGEAKKKKKSDAEQRRADRDRKRAKAAAKRAVMIAELEAVDAEEQRALAAQLRGEQEQSDLDADSDDDMDEDESEEDDD